MMSQSYILQKMPLLKRSIVYEIIYFYYLDDYFQVRMQKIVQFIYLIIHSWFMCCLSCVAVISWLQNRQGNHNDSIQKIIEAVLLVFICTKWYLVYYSKKNWCLPLWTIHGVRLKYIFWAKKIRRSVIGSNVYFPWEFASQKALK